MSMIEPTNYTTAMPQATIDGDQTIFNRIKASPSGKDELNQTAQEFEAVFISKMFKVLDKTVDREGGLFGEEHSYFDKFKSYMYNELGRDLASKPRTSFGFAKNIYEQMEKFVKD